MAFRFFTVSIQDATGVETELNAFLRSHKVPSVERHFVEQGPSSFWAISIDYAVAKIFKTWNAEPTKIFGKPFEGASIALDNNPALLGVGYIIGPRTSCIMLAGGMLSYLVLIPAIKYFGADLAAPLAPATKQLISEMKPGDIRTF